MLSKDANIMLKTIQTLKKGYQDVLKKYGRHSLLNFHLIIQFSSIEIFAKNPRNKKNNPDSRNIKNQNLSQNNTHSKFPI